MKKGGKMFDVFASLLHLTDTLIKTIGIGAVIIGLIMLIRSKLP